MKKKLSLVFNAIRIYENWPIWLAFKLHLVRDSRERIIRLRNGLAFATRFDLNEPGTIDDIFILDEYGGYRHAFPEGGTAIDVGGNIGAFSIAAASQVRGANVFTFEPSPDTFTRLAKNVQLNKLEYSVHAFNLAVAGTAGERMLSEDVLNSGLASIVFTENAAGDGERVSHLVKTTTLTDIFSDHKIERCDFLKMDCEGAEYEIFENTPDEVLKKIRALAMEYHGDPLPIEKRFHALGFEVRWFANGPAVGILSAWQK
jgi:FkbM family methyltransferase